MAKVEFRKAIIPDEVVALCDFDRATFQTYRADVFTVDEWKKYESYWMLVDDKIVGCTALEPSGDELWIASTGILPEFQKKGWGKKLKRWQIDYARAGGFARVAGAMRKSNLGSVKLNGGFGFKVRKIISNLYNNPAEDGIVMELLLPEPACPDAESR